MHVTKHKKGGGVTLFQGWFGGLAAHYGVTINKSIHTDNNVVYTARAIQDACTLEQQQLVSFCAVGTHRQNGIVELFIGHVVQCARILLLHALSKWPSVITKELWPFSIWNMVLFHDTSICRDKQKSPIKLFTSQSSTWQLGCLMYVLHKWPQYGEHNGKCGVGQACTQPF